VRVVGRYAINQRPTATAKADLASGRLMTEDEMRDGARVAMITSRFADELTAAGMSGARPGETVTVGGQSFKTVGVVTSPPGDRVFTIVVPFMHASSAMTPAPTPRVRTITVTAADVAEVPAIRKAIEAFAGNQAGWADKFTIVAYGPERLEQAARGILIFKLLMGAFTAISLVVGGIGIMNVLLASILERTREIGIRKAVGARRRDVLRQFMVEALTISVAGTAAGVALGLTTAFVVTAIIRAKTQAPMQAAFTWQTLAVTGIAAISVGLAAGVYPAVRASRLTAIDAIQRD
jgi:putative ABC transport system permease protein